MGEGQTHEELLAQLVEALEAEPGADLERLLLAHSREADWLRERIARLERAGLLRRAGDPGEPRPPLAGIEPLPVEPIDGRYRALSELGRGGMGRVFLAHDLRLSRDVAIKLEREAGDPASRARLQREAEVLAQLEHPGIVAVYDGGTTADGRAFCAMRVVGGRTLHDAIARAAQTQGDASEFGLARKIEIAIAICDAIGFAHGRGVVHRDLKPTNVMLGEAGEVQIIDWGLAKRVGVPDHGAATDRDAFASFCSGAYETIEGYAFGTPSYAAPEQARGEIAWIDERSDVFGLGAILHHLLAGRPPYYGKDREEVLQRAREGRPNDPDLRSAEDRVAPELVAICRKACAPDASRRYPSARELADDLRAFLELRVVRAYESGARAELGKWVKRNRAFASASVIAMLVLIGGLVGISVVQAAGKQAAATEQHAANRVAEFMVELFDASDPRHARAGEITARELLERGRAGIEGALTEAPLVQARLLSAMGRAYLGLGDNLLAADLLQKALTVFHHQGVTADQSVATILNSLGQAESNIGKYEEAEQHLLDAIEIQESIHGTEAPQIVGILNLAEAYRMHGRLDEAERHLRDVEEILRANDSLATDIGAAMLGNRASVRKARGDLSGAEADYRHLLQILDQVPTPPAYRYVTMTNFAIVLWEASRLEEARSWVEKAIDGQRSLLEPNHPDLLGSLGLLAVIEQREGRFGEAEKLQRAVLEGLKKNLGLFAQETLRAQHNLAGFLLHTNGLVEAELLLEDALDRQEPTIEAHDDPEYLGLLATLSILRQRQGDTSEAIRLGEMALEGYERIGASVSRKTSLLRQLVDLHRSASQADEVGKYEQRLRELGVESVPGG